MSAAFANGLADVLNIILLFVQILVIASVIISWVNADPRNPIVQMIRSSTEPLYAPFRKLTSKIPGPLDWAPFALLLVVIFLQKSVVFYLRMYARSHIF